ncbi:peptidyl-prolyl cis-trans isomerase [Aureococcus anophagefferens]|nr:peptidyl-prolyl cis-trans isomerase [Aureococcus anophagefferens]
MEDIAAPAEPAAAPAEKPAEPAEPAAAPSEASPSDQEAAAPAAAAPSRSRSRSPGPAKKERNDGKTEVGRQVYVGNLAFSSDKAMIEDKFGVFGKVTDVFLPMDANHKPRGFAFVTFSEAREAEDCAENLNDKEFDGRVREIDDLYYRYGRIDYIEIRRSAKMYAVVCYFEPRDADYAQRDRRHAPSGRSSVDLDR